MAQVYPDFESAKKEALARAFDFRRDYSVYEDLTEEAFYVRAVSFSQPAGTKRVFTTTYTPQADQAANAFEGRRLLAGMAKRAEATQDAQQTPFEQEQPPGTSLRLDPTSRANKPSQTTTGEQLREGRNVLDRLADAIEQSGVFEALPAGYDRPVAIFLPPADWRRLHAICAAMVNITAPISE